MERLRASWVVGGVVLIGAMILWAYWGIHLNHFYFDDIQNILLMPALHWEVLSWQGVWDVVTGGFLKQRPISNLSLALSWWQGGGEPAPFLWTNLLIHILNGLLVGWFLFLLLSLGQMGSLRAVMVTALMGALLWSLHPIQTQAVTYIVQRMAALSTLFVLASSISYIYMRQAVGWWRYLLLLVLLLSMTLGVTSKENALILPYILLLIEYTLFRRWHYRQWWDWLVLGVALSPLLYLLVDLMVNGPFARYLASGYEMRGITMSERLWTQPRVIMFHLSQWFWPLPSRFSLEHDFLLSRGWFSPPQTMMALVGLCVWIGLGLRLMLSEHRRLLGLMLLMFIVALVIESSLIPLEMVFEHRFYLPSVGLVGLMVMVALMVVQRWPQWGWPVWGAGALMVVVLGIAAQARVAVWGDPIALARSSAEHAPSRYRVWNTLGMGLIDKGDYEEARRVLLHAQQVAMQSWHILSSDTINGLAQIDLKQGNYAAAAAGFEQAIALAPKAAVYYWNLALAYEGLQRCSDADRSWRRYLMWSPATDRDRQFVIERLTAPYHQQIPGCSAGHGEG